jgi:two-component system, NarL family, nitrate/nitrite response regulator NarL
MPDCLRVVVVDDHPLFRSGVIQSLHLDKQIRVVGEGSTGREAVKLAEEHTPDLVLLDIGMAGNGIEAATEIMQLPQHPKIVMLTVSETEEDIVRALNAGAFGYVLKGIGARQLIDVVRSVAAGNQFVSPTLTHRLVMSLQAKADVGPSPLASLTPKEEKTLRLVVLGKSNREIGEELRILEKTVKFHMTQILRKLNVKSRLSAAMIARDHWDRSKGR